MNSDRVFIHMGEPVVIAQAGPEVKGWGYHQFPEVEHLADGRLHVCYHIAPDSIHSYGRDKGHAVSGDDGRTWTPMHEKPRNGGIPLPGGGRLRVRHLPPLGRAEVTLPHEPVASVTLYGVERLLYRLRDLPEALRVWPLERLDPGEGEWKLELKSIEYPGAVASLTEGVLPRRMFWRLRQAPDGRVWAIAYYYIDTGCRPVRIHALFFTSDDEGRTFRFLSDIPYDPIPEIDPKYDARSGFNEPDVAFLPDGSVLCLLRTTDGNGVGPLYRCRSTDGGRTWSAPEKFDDLGVWPTLLTLNNGVTLACYGRPGFYLRACGDAAGGVWDGRITVREPLAMQTDTCSYGDLVALTDDAAYLVYSDFQVPDRQGYPVKTICGRRIETRIR